MLIMMDGEMDRKMKNIPGDILNAAGIIILPLLKIKAKLSVNLFSIHQYQFLKCSRVTMNL